MNPIVFWYKIIELLVINILAILEYNQYYISCYENLTMRKVGKLVLVVGPMYSGKTSELLNYINVYRIGGKSYKIFKISKDSRYSSTEIVSHRGHKETAIVVPDSEKLISYVTLNDHAVFIDEIQFFNEKIIDRIKEMISSGLDVYCSGLDISYKNNPFDITGKLMCLADEIIKKKAVCYMCKEYNATVSHRTVSGTDSEVDIGGAEKYVAVCKNCYHNVSKEPTSLTSQQKSLQSQ